MGDVVDVIPSELGSSVSCDRVSQENSTIQRGWVGCVGWLVGFLLSAFQLRKTISVLAAGGMSVSPEII